jgi:GMP synthase-like glutamine amidotransferase
MKIAILKTDTVRPEFTAEFGQYPQMFIELLQQVEPGLEFIVYDVEHQQYPDAIDGIDAWLITGSKSSVYDDKPWIAELEEFVRLLHRQQKVVIGICFGHQLVAQALGGKTEKAAAGWGVGVHQAQWLSEPAWLGEHRDRFNLLVSHQDQVIEPAAGSVVLAGSEFCPNAVCQLGDHILTFQGHPEFIKDYSRKLMNFRREMLGEQVYEDGMASLATDTDQRQVARWIIDFIRHGNEQGQRQDTA